MKVAIGCDENGVKRKNDLIEVLDEKKIPYKDFWQDNNDRYFYLQVAKNVVQGIQQCHYDRGILICGTGIGMAIFSNKCKGISAAVCHDVYSAKRSILSNDCQILVMGAYIIGKKEAQEILSIWLDTERTGGSIDKLKKMEKVLKEINYGK